MVVLFTGPDAPAHGPKGGVDGSPLAAFGDKAREARQEDGGGGLTPDGFAQEMGTEGVADDHPPLAAGAPAGLQGGFLAIAPFAAAERPAAGGR